MTKITDKIKKKFLEEKRKSEKKEKEYREKLDLFNKIVNKSEELLFKEFLPDIKDLFKFLKKEFYKGPKVKYEPNYLPWMSQIYSSDDLSTTYIKIEIRRRLHLFDDHYDRIIKNKKIELSDVEIVVGYHKNYWTETKELSDEKYFEMNKKEEALEYAVEIYNQFIHMTYEDD